MEKANRLMSLDAFRGFDMLWIMGGDALVCKTATLFGHPDFHKSFGHVDWIGLQFMDLVFPTFLFMSGVSFPFSVAKSLERGLTRGQIALRALRRYITLVLLGIIYSAFPNQFDFAHFRIPSVLGYIGFGWMFAAWIYLYVPKLKVRIGIGILILATVSLIFGLIPAPDVTVNVERFSPEWHLGCWLDRTILGPHAYLSKYDPEGFGGLFCTIVTAMFGMFAGEITRWAGMKATGTKTLLLLAAATLCVASGFALSMFYPIVKKLWSPSFVLITGGYSFAMFALFYWSIDVKGWSKWSFFFRVIGMNSITIYLAQRFINFGSVSKFFFSNVAGLLPETWGAIVFSLGYIAVCWIFLYFLYRKNVFLKV